MIEPADFERLRQLLSGAVWTVAKTTVYPHSYTLRRTWANDADFTWAVAAIRQHGEERLFFGRSYIYLDVGGFTFWSMGAALSATVLINRAPLPAADTTR